MSRLGLLAGLLLLAAGLAVAGCSQSGDAGRKDLPLAPESALPAFVRDAPPQVREAYRFAIANQDLLRAFPCYCGCGRAGHQSNLECYIKETRADGTVLFDNHAFG